MSLENQVTRVSTGMKDTLKTLINKLGGNVTDELIDQYPELAASLDQVDTAGSAAQALSDAKKYTDQKISEIPTPDVSGQISTHNTDTSAHSSIRNAISGHATNADIHVTADEKSAWNDGIQLESLTSVMPCSAAWSSVVYGNGIFVSVGVYSDENDNPVYVSAYSINGVTWTQGGAPSKDSSGSLPKVVYGNGVFVVISGTSRSYSADGITWHIIGTSVTFNSLAYGNGKFVLYGSIVKSDDQTVYVVQYSEDGEQWSQSVTSLSGTLTSMTYGNGKFVGIRMDSNIAAYSEDGITWTTTTLPSSAYWKAVTYGNGRFIVLNNHGTTGTYVKQNTTTSLAAYSDDGITWTKISMGVSLCWQHISYGNGRFIAVGTSTDGYVLTETSRAAYSDDGLTWVEVSLPAASYWGSAGYGNGKFVALSGVAIAFKSKICAYSEDGVAWEQDNKILQTASGTDVTAEVKEIIGSSSSNVPHASTHATGGSDPITPESIGAIPSSDKGKAGGVATLDNSGKVPSGQIPSLEYAGKTHASTHAADGSDPITPVSIGAMDAAWNTKIVAKSQTGSSVTGWYRVLCSNKNAGANTAIVNLRHSYTHGTPCSILALVVMDAYAPKINIIESSFKEKSISVSKLRLTTDESSNVYLDYYYGMSDTNTVAISALNMCSYGDITIMDFAPVDETPTGETILVTQNLRQIPSGMIPIATIVPVTLAASAWDSSAKTQTITVAGVLADETKQLITPAPALESQTAYYNAGIRCTGQAANNLTFTAKTIPTANLKAYVTIQEVGA